MELISSVAEKTRTASPSRLVVPMSRPQAHWLDLPHATDERGVLTSIESGLDIPFEPRRVFFIRDARGERGLHAHRSTRQLLIAVAESFCVEVSDGFTPVAFRMDNPNRGLYLPPMTWVRLHDFAPGAVCLVLADTLYDDASYIRDWDEFVAISAREGSA
jgi:hypothetical protein